MHERLSSRSARPLRFLQFIKFGLSLWCRISLDMLRLSIRGCCFLKKITKKYIDLNKYIIDIRVVYAIEFHYACSWNITYGTFSAKFHFLPNIQTTAGLFTTQTLSSNSLPQTFKMNNFLFKFFYVNSNFICKKQ